MRPSELTVVDAACEVIGFDTALCSQCDHPKGAHTAYGRPAECSLCGCDSFEPYPEAATAFDATPCHGCGHQRVAHYGDVWGTYCRCCPCQTFHTNPRHDRNTLAAYTATAILTVGVCWAIIQTITR